MQVAHVPPDGTPGREGATANSSQVYAGWHASCEIAGQALHPDTRRRACKPRQPSLRILLPLFGIEIPYWCQGQRFVQSAKLVGAVNVGSQTGDTKAAGPHTKQAVLIAP